MASPDFFAEMALHLHDQDSTEATVELITKYARMATSCDDAGILLVQSRNRLETASATSDRVVMSHDLQRTLDEGPCLDAMEGVGIFVAGDVAHDPRWPHWGRSVADLGIRSAMSIRLETKDRRYGSLNLYADVPDAFDDDDLAVASIFARHASIALATAHNEEGLQVAIDARKLIGQAQGILMERFDIEADAAFAVLRRYSQNHNAKLRDVAGWVVANRTSSIAQITGEASDVGAEVSP